MLVFEIMLALIATIGLVLAICAIMFIIAVVVAKIAATRADKNAEELRAKYPDYYAKVDEYNAKYGEAVRFETEHINSKKQRIDELEKEIKYLPEIYTTSQVQEIAKLKEEIYENTWKFKKLVSEYTVAQNEATALREKYQVNM